MRVPSVPDSAEDSSPDSRRGGCFQSVEHIADATGLPIRCEVPWRGAWWEVRPRDVAELPSLDFVSQALILGGQ